MVAGGRCLHDSLERTAIASLRQGGKGRAGFLGVLEQCAACVGDRAGRGHARQDSDHVGGGDRSETVSALGTIVPTLIARSYHLVTVPQLLGLRTAYTYRR